MKIRILYSIENIIRHEGTIYSGFNIATESESRHDVNFGNTGCRNDSHSLRVTVPPATVYNSPHRDNFSRFIVVAHRVITLTS